MQLDNTTPNTSAEDPGLPGLHPPTLLRAFWRMRRWVVVVGAMAVFAGLFAGYGLGSRVYESSTLLLFKPAPAADGEQSSDPELALATQLHLVKLPATLSEVRERVGRPLSLEGLGRSIRVERQGKTDLVRIMVRDSDRYDAAELANTVREVFLDRQRTSGVDETSRRIDAITGRLGTLRRELEVADSALQAYAQENRIVDLDKEAQWYLEEFTAVNMLYEEARSDQETNQLQRAGIDEVIDQIRNSVEAESASLEGLGAVNMRIERLRDAIADDQRQRAMNAELAQRELDLRRARVLVEQGVWSEARLQEAQNAYDRQLAYTVDTDQVEAWREELGELQSQMLPDQGSSPSEPLLKDVMLRKFDIELEGVTLQQRVDHLEGARGRVRARLDSIPLLERGYFARMREVNVREAVLEDLEKDLADAQTQLESEHVSFEVVSIAEPPIFPLDSNRRILFALGVVGVFGLGLLLLVARVVLDPTVRSLAESRVRTDLPFTAEFPALADPREALESHSGVRERFDRLARRIRLRTPGEQRVLVVASPRSEAGSSWVTDGIAAALGRQDERVLVIETTGGGIEVEPDRIGRRAEPLAAEFEEASEKLRTLALRGSEAAEERLSARKRVRVRRLLRRARAVRARINDLVERLRSDQAAETMETTTPASVRLLSTTDSPSHANFADVVSLRAELGDAGRHLSVRGVRHVEGGRNVESAMLRSRALEAALERARFEYDVVLVNTPAILDSPHALHLADFADGLVLVAAAEDTRAGELKRAVEELKDTDIDVVAAVLNRVHIEFLEAA